ncbi:MAG TPA: Hpt domain-containing protein, partial [Thiobacillus sp.]|nr:Hpt domain-containing protein [Thiobacillus sp.]
MSALLDYDTGPLNWVRGDIDAALQAALGRIQAYSVDVDLTNALRLARDDAHQVTGALRMVGLEGAATLAGALESSLDDINENRLTPSDEVLRALRNAMEGLQRWVKDLADGRGSGELALFPLYKRLRELQGAERIFEGELFFPDLRLRTRGKTDNDGLTQEALAAEVKKMRSLFQRGLLAFLRNVEADQGLQRMRDALTAIERIAPSQASQTFWWACVGFVDSLIARGVEADFHVKQLLARVDLQMRRLIEGSPQVAERLLRDALFFVAKSESMEGRAAEVRSRFGLDRYLPGRGMLDPEALARMRPVLDALQSGLKAARDHWHAWVEGNADQQEPFQTQLIRMQPQAQMLESSGLMPLLDELGAAALAAVGREGDAREQVNLEVAATLLFMQSGVDQEDVLHADFAVRAEAQQARLRALIEGREMPVSNVESASQREAERDMLVQMALEVGQNLKQMEEALDAFFRDANEREALANLPALAQQAQGALTMLELPDAASLLAVAATLAQSYASEGYPDEATQQRLANAFSSLGLFIESYCAGRADAASMLRPALIELGVIDADSIDESAFDDTVEAGLPTRKAEVQAGYVEWRDQPDDARKKKYLDALTELGRDAELIDDVTLKQQTRAALDASREAVEAPLAFDADIAAMTGLAVPRRATPEIRLTQEEDAPVAGEADLSRVDLAEPADVMPAEVNAPAAGSVVEFAQPVAAIEAVPIPEPVDPVAAETAAPAVGALLAAIPEGVELELLEIFLEEANEVLAAMGEASNACQSNPDDQASLTIIRRGFHTLKGSGRMVGLEELGETAWRLEQLMNGWLTEKKPASSEMLRLVERARGVFQDWVDALLANQPVVLPVFDLLAAVDRVSQGQALDVAPAADAIRTAWPEAAAVEVAADALTAGELDVEMAAAAETEGQSQPVAEAPRNALADDAATAEMAEAADRQAEAHELPPEARAAEVGATIEYAVAHVESAGEAPAEPVGLVNAEAEAQVESYAPDEICIGTVCLSTGLYDIFMVEAHQRLAVLQEEALRHADVTDSTVSEHARRAVHTLGGIAGTAGIAALCELSQALEQYWNRFVRVAQPSAHLPLVQDTVVRLHEMIETIAAGRLPDAASDLIAALGELEDEQVMPAAESVFTLAAESADEIPADETPVEAVVEAAPVAVARVSDATETRHASGLLDVDALVPDFKPAAPAPVFERREVADEIDQQLLPVFLEEADTLMPDTSARLRAWRAAPGEAAARDVLQRNLHTIKGSARMVGAMRLGELTHVMESRVIAVIEGHLNASADVFETLEAQLDRLADAVDRLKLGDLAPALEETPAPLAAPIEPVLGQVEAAAAETATLADPLETAKAATRDSNALTLRVRADWVDRMVNQAGEVAIARSRIESEVFAFKRHVNELSEALARLRGHIREVEIQAESQMQATFQTQGGADEFDPLEFDRFTR